LRHQPDPFTPLTDFDLVIEADPVHQGLNLMISIRPPFQYLQVKVDFCRR